MSSRIALKNILYYVLTYNVITNNHRKCCLQKEKIINVTNDSPEGTPKSSKVLFNKSLDKNIS